MRRFYKLIFCYLIVMPVAIYATSIANMKMTDGDKFTLYLNNKAIWESVYSPIQSIGGGSICRKLDQPKVIYEIKERAQNYNLYKKLYIKNRHIESRCGDSEVAELTYKNYMGSDLINTKNKVVFSFVTKDAVNGFKMEITDALGAKVNIDADINGNIQISSKVFDMESLVNDDSFCEILLPFINQYGQYLLKHSNRHISEHTVKNDKYFNECVNCDTYKITFNDNDGGKFIVTNRGELSHIVLYSNSKSEDGSKIINSRAKNLTMGLIKKKTLVDIYGKTENRYVFEKYTDEKKDALKEMTSKFQMLNIQEHEQTINPFITARKCVKKAIKRFGLGIGSDIYASIEILGQGSALGDFEMAKVRITKEGMDYIKGKKVDAEDFVEMILLIAVNNIGKYMSSSTKWQVLEKTRDVAKIGAVIAVTAVILLSVDHDGDYDYDYDYDSNTNQDIIDDWVCY